MRRQGYAFFEAMIAVALVVVLGFTVAPPLRENLREGKVARAQVEADAIFNAVLDFRRDVGHWPVDPGSSEATWTRLVGNESVGGGTSAVPAGLATAAAGGAGGGLALGTMSAHLVRNQDERGKPIYQASRHPHIEPGWNGPYLEQVPLDPWGRSYVVSVVPGGGEGVQGSEDAAEVVLVVSAGPDGVLQTALDVVPPDGACGGDDVGLVVLHPGIDDL
ncbi:MAG: type II secretion system protein GspG [Candidatus Krumholzibacteriia bacterium]